MQKTSGVLVVMALICLSIPSATAQEAPRYFVLFDSGDSAGNSAADAQSQTPRAIPRAVPVKRKPMTGSERWSYYLRSTYGLRSLAYTAAGTGINQARDTVPEWGQGMEGYSKRYASSFGQKAIKRSIHHGLASLFHEDPRFRRSDRSGLFDRALHAAGQTLFAYKDDGGRRVGYSRFVATGAAAYISRQWRPERYHSADQYFSSAVRSLGIDAAKNVFNEFWPDIRRMLGR